jgi:DnaJ-class molecular chaperone
MAKSYFAILGISQNATVDEIRSAYRRLAKEFHPDHYTGRQSKIPGFTGSLRGAQD